MSYILDALKRAESERDRGAVPTLNTPLPARAAASRNGRPLLYAMIGGAVLLLVLAALVSRWLFSSPSPQPAEPVAAAPPVVQAKPAPVLPSLSPAGALAPAPAAPALQSQPLVPAARALPEPTPTPAPVTAPIAKPVAAPIVALNELPEALRRELPPLKAGGAMVSDIPANRMLIINGQLLHEGEAVAPGLVLENIGLRTALLSYKGQRFTINY
ncbi:MAG TPA: general secretion pathway protein GspB [Burkholderiaceae bacterium]|jgi:general secretion pathway protein B